MDKNFSEIKVGDIKFFHEDFDNKRNRESFISREKNGKIVISEDIFHRSGFFRIDKVLVNKERYSIVKLGERIKPKQIYAGINYKEAKEILEEKGFEVFLRPFSYQAFDDEIRNEYQLLAWHTRLGIFINGSTWGNAETFNNLDIMFPNMLSNGGSVLAWDADMHSREEIRIGLIHYKFNHTDILSRIIAFVESIVDTDNVGKIRIGNKINGVVSYYGLRSYSDTDDNLNDNIREQKELEEKNYKKTFSMLPESGKRFVLSHLYEN